ncbi:hypothetical protein ACUN24_06665 [Pedobacter sp. WC2501]|uniref:hypothetical protein n=1 Tax=Pedobacter sp. WC2501 TaxID=3461400 RepID=UPI00404572F7
MQIIITIPILNLKLTEPVELTLDSFKLFDCMNVDGISFSSNFMQQFGMSSMPKISSSHLLRFQGDPKEVSFFSDCNTLAEIGHTALNFASSLFNALWFVKDNSVYAQECFVEHYEGIVGTASFKSLHCNRHFLSRYNSDHSGNFATTMVSISDMLRLINIDRIIKINLKLDPSIKQLIPRTPRLYGVMTDELNFLPYTLNRYLRALMVLAKVQSEARVILKIAFQMSLYEALFTIGRERLTEQVTEKPALFIGGTESEVDDHITFFKKAYDIRSKFFHGDRINNDPAALVEMNKRLDQCTRIIFNKVLDDLMIFTLSDSKTDKKRFRQFWHDLAGFHNREVNWELPKVTDLGKCCKAQYGGN